MIYNGTFFPAGQPRPLSELEHIPPTLRKPEYIIKHDASMESADTEADSPASLSYTLGTQYSVDERGHRRAIQREIINLERMRQQQEAIENALNAEPDAQTQAALAEVQAAHDTIAARDIAEAQFEAQERGNADEFAKQSSEEQDAEIALLSGNVMSPTVDEAPNVEPTPHVEMPDPKPKLRKRYLRRGAVWMAAKKIRHYKPGENVCVKNADGQFVLAGKVGKKGSLPMIPMEEH
jgi:hypothetical protein